MVECAPVIPIVRNAAKRIKTAERSQLVQIYEHFRSMSNELIRRLVIENDRIDILAVAVLGYVVKPFHLRMLQWQFQHPNSLQLVYRGAGKSTLCTVTKAIHYLIKDRDLRILIASKTKTNAESFLKEIKGHFESNEKLVEVFGAFYDPARVSKWDNSEIEVLGRSRIIREASITCVGVDSAVVSKHYDVILSDDLVDEDNARTNHMRNKTRTWYYQSLDPTLEPPNPARAHVGEHHRLGTHYHFADLWNHLKANELKGATQVIPALDERGRSPWPEKHSPAWFHEKRTNAGTIIFRAQYQCDTEAMKGEIFQFDYFQFLDSRAWPDTSELQVMMGVDLAISGKDKSDNDQFAIVVLGTKGKPFVGKDPIAVYVLDFYAAHLRFPQQKPKILEFYDKWNPLACGIEVNAYQAAQYQTLKEERPTGRFIPIHTDKDKISRAWKLSALFEAERVFFQRDLHGRLIDQLVLFPNHNLKDGFDAFDLAVQASKRRRVRDRGARREPGLL